MKDVEVQEAADTLGKLRLSFANFIGDFSGKGEALAGTGGVKIAW
jgi:hypothetical protein